MHHTELIQRQATIDIPEILDLICRLLSRDSRVRFAYSSRLFFYVAMPHIWGKLRGAHKLILLVPGVKISRTPEKNFDIVFPDNVPSNLSRLSIYAPLVRTLHIFETESHLYTISIWPGLAALSAFLREHFLVNLRRLIINSNTCSVIDVINWVALLASPSLVEIQLPLGSHDSRAWIPEGQASALLACVAERCPSLQVLGLLARSPDEHNFKGIGILPRPSGLLSNEHISSMKYLRTLTIGKYAMQPHSLRNIGLLPALERLSIHDPPERAELSKLNARFPRSLFPALRHLELHRINSCEVAQIWRIDPLVKRLTTVKIDAVSPDLEYVHESGKRGLISWLPELFKNSLCIRHLSISFRTGSSTSIQLLHSRSMATILKLPLQSLCLSMIKILDLDSFCRQLGVSCPGLRRLHIPHTDIAFSALPQITNHLPLLERLGANVSWTSSLPKSTWSYSSNSLASLEYDFHVVNNSNSNVNILDIGM
ncbi:fanconi anemia group M protein [Ceratobasidium sp. AG-Ba]|nr:fanconi anemia group M protein [Ceratobasidium sp. AG-Ba]